MQQNGLGIDFGDVIAGSRVSTDSRGIEIESDYLAINRFLRVAPVEDAFECIRVLVAECFGERSWVISKWRESVKEKCLTWLRHYHFAEITGIPLGRVLFCETRADKVRMARERGITDFVDNKLEVLSPMVGIVPNLYLFRPSPREIVQYEAVLPCVKVVNDWRDIVRHVLGKEKP